ncbi:hypothetical protein CEXT_763961 [Caerostris extrusa]|uniref:Uncharacterized protein n=1 Tax=Caerostris extrusa TaxID=172846 RepID=A0AAV4NQ95_CAEEX|nr:hypothetical protein CEXT_763961 [Caerostris extrusa]
MKTRRPVIDSKIDIIGNLFSLSEMLGFCAQVLLSAREGVGKEGGGGMHARRSFVIYGVGCERPRRLKLEHKHRAALGMGKEEEKK